MKIEAFCALCGEPWTKSHFCRPMEKFTPVTIDDVRRIVREVVKDELAAAEATWECCSDTLPIGRLTCPKCGADQPPAATDPQR